VDEGALRERKHARGSRGDPSGPARLRVDYQGWRSENRGGRKKKKKRLGLLAGRRKQRGRDTGRGEVDPLGEDPASGEAAD